MSVFDELEAAFSSPAFRQQVSETVRSQCLTLFRQGLHDTNEYIQSSCAQLVQVLRDKAQGELEEEDVMVYLNSQRALLQIQLNNAEIATRARMQAIVAQLLNITLTTLIRAL
nr:hypothetical protein [uncultured Enterobacter sp.]